LLKQFVLALRDSYPQSEIRKAAPRSPILDRIRSDPSEIMRAAGMGMNPDRW
jgi:hypothetical protein